MLPSSRACRLARVGLQALPIARRSFVATTSEDKPSEIFIRKLRYMYKLMDVSQDGILNAKDLATLADRMKVNAKMTEVETERLKKSFSAWWNDSLAVMGGIEDLDEEAFLQMRLKKWNAPEGEVRRFMRPTMELMFKAVDTDGDGVISYKEWANFFHACCPHSKPGEAEESFRILDTNKDGKVESEEFLNHLFDFHYSQIETPNMHMFGKVP